MSVLLGNGDGTFQPATGYISGGDNAFSIVIGDANGNGKSDLVVGNLCQKRGLGCPGGVSVLLGNGDGTFQTAVTYDSGGSDTVSVAIQDLTGDGRPDLVAASANYYGSGDAVGVLLNTLTYKTATTLASSPNPSQVNQTVTFTATVTSTPPVPNGEVVTFYNGQTELGTGATTNGAAALTTSFSEAKTYTIKSTYPGDAFRKPSAATVKQVVNP